LEEVGGFWQLMIWTWQLIFATMIMEGKFPMILHNRLTLIAILITAILTACGTSPTGQDVAVTRMAQISSRLAAIKADALPIAVLLLLGIGVGMVAIKDKTTSEEVGDRRAEDELEGIIRYYSQIIQLDPGHATAYFNRGLAYYSNDELESAISDWDAAIQLIPADFEAYYYRGLAYADQGEKTKAIADLNKAMELCGDSLEILCLNARSLLEKLDGRSWRNLAD
jgi:tetratricopeptide (TPR) repeat protein